MIYKRCNNCFAHLARMIYSKTGLLVAVLFLAQAILFKPCCAGSFLQSAGGAVSGMASGAYQESERYKKSYASEESESYQGQYAAGAVGQAVGAANGYGSQVAGATGYATQAMGSVSRSASKKEQYNEESERYQAGNYQAAGQQAIGGAASYGSNGANAMMGGASAASREVRSTQTTVQTITTTTTTVKACDYIGKNFAAVGSKSMGSNDEKDAEVLNSFIKKDNGCFLTSLLKEKGNRGLLGEMLGMGKSCDAGSLINYFKNGLYIKENKIHRAALALKRCKINTKSYHKQLLPREDVLKHIGSVFVSESNESGMMKQWRSFLTYNNGLYFQSFFEDNELWRDLARQVGYSGSSADEFKVFLLRNRFRKEKRSCKISKCMRMIRKKFCGGGCKPSKPKQRGPPSPKRSAGGCGGGGGCGPKHGKCR